MDALYMKKDISLDLGREYGSHMVQASSRKERQYAPQAHEKRWDDSPSEFNTGELHRVEVTASLLNVRKGPGVYHKIAGQLKRGTVVEWIQQSGDWLQIEYLGKIGYIAEKYTKPLEPLYTKNTDTSLKSLQALEIARKYLGQTTKDLLGKLTYLSDLSKNENTNNGYNLNCANFVSAILNEVGLLSKHVVSCSKLRQICLQSGYKQILKSEAKPGDIWINSHHTELVDSIDNGIITLIGSNNNGDKIQEITLDSKSAQKDGEIYSFQT